MHANLPYVMSVLLHNVFVAPTVDGHRRRGPGKPADDAQMMSQFGEDPNADLMDSTRGGALSCVNVWSVLCKRMDACGMLLICEIM